MFNNCHGGFAMRNAIRMKELLASKEMVDVRKLDKEGTLSVGSLSFQICPGSSCESAEQEKIYSHQGV